MVEQSFGVSGILVVETGFKFPWVSLDLELSSDRDLDLDSFPPLVPLCVFFLYPPDESIPLSL